MMNQVPNAAIKSIDILKASPSSDISLAELWLSTKPERVRKILTRDIGISPENGDLIFLSEEAKH